MNTAELKNDLHKLIVETDDYNVLSQLFEYLKKLKSGKNQDWWDSLTDDNLDAINLGLADYKDGHFHNDEEVRSSIHEYIEKYESK